MSPGPRDAGSPFDPGLQLERTLLAWQRTCLSLAVGSAVAIRLGTASQGVLVVPLGLAALCLSVVGWASAAQRYRRSQASLTSEHSALAAGGRLITVTAVATGLLGVCGVVFLIAG